METNPNEIVRVHIRVKGRVQGVGFRAHVEYAALQIGVLGWVGNVGRDTVEAVAEGAREQVEQFVESVKRGPNLSRVDEAEVNYEEPLGQLTGFTVKRSM
ncbi:MAG: acylphosphatase [Anaerolineaceae bacterium]|jgi:acylphosphatase|nr:MAG: acylphosphatase [Anaerolineaceae bacterium]